MPPMRRSRSGSPACPASSCAKVPAAATDNADGTRLFADVARALSDVPADRIGGVAIVSDGRITTRRKISPVSVFPHRTCPCHRRSLEYDRRIELTSSPKFALVRSTPAPQFPPHRRRPVAEPRRCAHHCPSRRRGRWRRHMVPGEERSVDIAIPHAGNNIVEVEAPPLLGELSPLNNTGGRRHRRRAAGAAGAAGIRRTARR